MKNENITVLNMKKVVDKLSNNVQVSVGKLEVASFSQDCLYVNCVSVCVVNAGPTKSFMQLVGRGCPCLLHCMYPWLPYWYNFLLLLSAFFCKYIHTLMTEIQDKNAIYFYPIVNVYKKLRYTHFFWQEKLYIKSCPIYTKQNWIELSINILTTCVIVVDSNMESF